MFTHIDFQGSLKMVDVTDKKDTLRKARAFGKINLPGEVIKRIKENNIAKGNVLEAARLGGIMASKKTADLIPLCHPLSLTSSDINFNIRENSIEITCQVKTTGKTGVEMEALTGVSIAALTIYDMCKSVTKDMTIGNICLIEKSGGKSGTYTKHKDRGEIIAICTSEKKGTPKKPVSSARLIENFGIEGDAHGGPWHRQISILAMESIEKMKNRGIEISDGAFGENIITKGLDLISLPVGTLIKLGNDAIGEVTQIGKECHSPCIIHHTLGDCIMPKEGIFIKILKSGDIKTGDLIKITKKEMDK